MKLRYIRCQAADGCGLEERECGKVLKFTALYDSKLDRILLKSYCRKCKKTYSIGLSVSQAFHLEFIPREACEVVEIAEKILRQKG